MGERERGSLKEKLEECHVNGAVFIFILLIRWLAIFLSGQFTVFGMEARANPLKIDDADTWISTAKRRWTSNGDYGPLRWCKFIELIEMNAVASAVLFLCVCVCKFTRYMRAPRD